MCGDHMGAPVTNHHPVIEADKHQECRPHNQVSTALEDHQAQHPDQFPGPADVPSPDDQLPELTTRGEADGGRLLGGGLVTPHLRHEDVTSTERAAQEHPDNVSLATQDREQPREGGEPGLARHLETQGEEHHGRGHLVRVVQEREEIKHGTQRDVQAAPDAESITVGLLR